MYVDAFTLSALVDELFDTIVGGRVQDVIDTDPTGIGLEIYANRTRHYLYLSADKQTPRVHLVSDKLRRGTQRPTQLGLLFRRRVEGGRIAHISQPPYERVLMLDVEHAEAGESTIVIEVMPRRSNLLLINDGIIADCIWRVSAEDNRYRVSLPNHRYELPPPMDDRLDPKTMTLADLQAIFDANEDDSAKVSRLLSRYVLGMSPLIAREAIFRATGQRDIRADEADVSALYGALSELIAPLIAREWQPGIVLDTDDQATAFSVYPIKHLENWQPVASISEALAAYFGEPVGDEAYAQAKRPVQAVIDEAKIKTAAKVESLVRGLKDDTEREELQHSGELILAYQYMIKEGQEELRAQYDPEGPELIIKLDPSLTPLENAQKYFDRYNRSKRALKSVPELLEDARTEARYVEQLETDLENASNWPEIDDVIRALRERGYLAANRKIKSLGGGGKSGPMRFTFDGYVIWVGRNSRQNELVTFKHANSQDLWLHARDVPGAHVVIRNDGRRIPDDLIEKAARVAAHYSSKRHDGSVPVDVTRVKYVRKIKGAGAGMVTYRNEQTLQVAPHDEEIFKA